MHVMTVFFSKKLRTESEERDKRRANSKTGVPQVM